MSKWADEQKAQELTKRGQDLKEIVKEALVEFFEEYYVFNKVTSIAGRIRIVAEKIEKRKGGDNEEKQSDEIKK